VTSRLSALQRGFPSRELDSRSSGIGNATNMSAKTVDQKLSFEATDMTPGPRGRVWRRDCLQLAGKCDSRGFSIADTLLRQDEYAVIGPAVGGGGMAAPGAPPPPVGATQLREAQQYRKKRLKEAYEWVVLH
jgi:hypothetical protein